MAVQNIGERILTVCKKSAIEEAVAIERTVIYHLGKESPRQADYIHGILNEHLMRYTASKESEGKTFPDYIGALMADELDHCIQLSKIYRSLKQQENEIRQAQIAEQDRVYQQSVNTEKEKSCLRRAANHPQRRHIEKRCALLLQRRWLVCGDLVDSVFDARISH
ncbi:MAG: hypothetical protein ACLS3C_16520 [Oscillospiraceae bacterium]